MALRRNHLPRKVAQGARGHQGAPDSTILDLATRLEDAAILLRLGRSVVRSELHAFLGVPLGTQQQCATVARPPDDQTVATHHGRARASARLLFRIGYVDLTKLGFDEAKGGLERALGRRSPQGEVVRE